MSLCWCLRLASGSDLACVYPCLAEQSESGAVETLPFPHVKLSLPLTVFHSLEISPVGSFLHVWTNNIGVQFATKVPDLVFVDYVGKYIQHYYRFTAPSSVTPCFGNFVSSSAIKNSSLKYIFISMPKTVSLYQIHIVLV